MFLTWIYGQLSNMLKELKDLNETYKYKMFRGLAWTLGTFVTLFTTLTVAMLAAEGSQTQSWEWKFEWINVVSWEVRQRPCQELVADTCPARVHTIFICFTRVARIAGLLRVFVGLLDAFALAGAAGRHAGVMPVG